MSELSTADVLSLGLSRTWYALSRALRLDRLRSLLGGSLSLEDAPVWLLGARYSCRSGASEAEQEEALARLLHHFQSIAWMTYRTSFTPICVGDVHLRSDAGWGCTLRSGQMVLAEGLQRHLLGPGWRWPQPPHGDVPAAAAALEAPPELSRLLQLFWDTPAERNPFSLHNLCLHGRRCGVVPGRWLGPWVMCHTLEAAASAAQAHHDLGVTVAVLADAGGGAPLLVASRFEAAFGGHWSSGNRVQEQPRHSHHPQQLGGAEAAAGGEGAGSPAALAAAAAAAAVASPEPSELVSVDSTTLAVEAPVPAAALAASTCQLSPDGGGGGGSRGLILLVPLVLGLGKLNPRYAPQLEAVLSWPQSIGIVGGRPSSSLYFVGVQPAAAATPAAEPAAAAAAAAGGGAGAAPAAAGAATNGPVPAAQPSAAAAAAVTAPAADAGHLQAAPTPQAAAARQQGQQAPGSPQRHAAGGSSGGGAGMHGHSGSGGGSSGSSIIYLDPHTVQEAACSDGDWLTFRCEAPRSMPLASIDPSLALGFYCGSLEEYRDLVDCLAALERASAGAPLVCVATAAAAAAAAARYDSPHASEWVADELSSEAEEGEEGEEQESRQGGAAAAAAATHEAEEGEEGDGEEEPAEVGPEEAAAAAAEEAAAAAADARRRQQRLEEEPEVVAPPSPAAAASAAPPSAVAAAAAAAAAAATGQFGPPRVQVQHPRAAPPGSPSAAAAGTPRQASRGWEVL